MHAGPGLVTHRLLDQLSALAYYPAASGQAEPDTVHSPSPAVAQRGKFAIPLWNRPTRLLLPGGQPENLKPAYHDTACSYTFLSYVVASMHTFLLVNSYDLSVGSVSAYKFIAGALAKNEFRFSLIQSWLMKCVVQRR